VWVGRVSHECAERPRKLAAKLRHIVFGLHEGDSRRLNVEYESKGRHLEDVLTKFRAEMLERRRL
jgi:hypothetical protein